MEKLVGEHVVKRALAKLPDEVRRDYEALTPLSWFPALWFNDIVAAVAAEMKMDVLAFHSMVIHRSAEQTLVKVWAKAAAEAAQKVAARRAMTSTAITQNGLSAVCAERAWGRLTKAERDDCDKLLPWASAPPVEL
jgi:hypothetical protein